MRSADLKTFIDVVEAGGMSQAAAASGVSQPGISRTIRELEAATGTALLRRTGRGVDLTPAGIVFLEFARDHMKALETMLTRVRSLAGTMTIAFPRRVGAFFFAPLYRRFMSELPAVTLVTLEALSEEIAKGMSDGQIDVAVTYLPDSPGSGLVLKVFSEQLYLAGCAGPLFEGDGPIPLSRLEGHDLLLNRTTNRYRRLIDQKANEHGISLSVAREIETAEGLLAFAMEGQGVTILPYSNMVEEVTRGDVLARPLIKPVVNRGIYLHAGRHLDMTAAQRVFNTIQNCLSPLATKLRWDPVR